MPGHNIERLETDLKALNKIIAGLTFDSELEQILKHLHQPGWTTPAEFQLVSGVVTAMSAQAKTLGEQKRVLIAGIKEIATAGQLTGAGR